jgi:hemerythrin-like domain-containing protein
MKRDDSLVPLSHDHHRALVRAQRLRRAADGDVAVRRRGAAQFLSFFADETIRHFRQEEERLFPLLVGASDCAEELLVQALLEHQRLHTLVARVNREVIAGDVDAALLRQTADLLESHTRFEERRLFPLLEETARDELSRLDLVVPGDTDSRAVFDLFEALGRGPLWDPAIDGELNATLIAWDAGHGPPEYVNSDLDVLILVLEGSASVTIDGIPHEVRSGALVIVEKGLTRRVTAGAEGVRYLSVHRKRTPLQIVAARRPAAHAYTPDSAA